MRQLQTKKSKRPTKAERLEALQQRDYARMYRTSTPRRHDFRTPQQRMKEALKTALRTTVWPVML